ncbi:MAG TPA: prepilin-type N-terminal cleavage/methylation domain-containing protein [Candidatus Paceibacterota bacterium]
MNKKGFTLVEMLVSIAIFSVIIVAFIGILVVILQIQAQSSSSQAVNQESQFLLQKVQYYVESASVITPTSTPSTLVFYVASSSLDPSYITLSSGTVYLQQTATGTLQALTSPKVNVTNLSFTRNTNPPGHDTVSVSFTMAYNTLNAEQAFSQLFQSTVEHVSAATFDTSVLPSAGGEPLGNSTYYWNPINGVINFSGNNVGIGSGDTSPSQPLEVNGGFRLNPTGVSEPTCSTSIRGTLWFANNGGSKDDLYLCASNASGTVAWRTIY